MSEQDHASSSMNDSGTGKQIDTSVTQPGSLAVLAADLRRIRPALSDYERGPASNLIEQLDGIKTPADLDRMRPFMARSMRLLQEAGR